MRGRESGGVELPAPPDRGSRCSPPAAECGVRVQRDGWSAKARRLDRLRYTSDDVTLVRKEDDRGNETSCQGAPRSPAG